jgi:hypothetical protein
VNEIKVSWNQTTAENVSLQIIDHLGQVVYSSDAQPMATGLHTTNISTSEFANGIYFLNVKGENSNVMKKITVMK